MNSRRTALAAAFILLFGLSLASAQNPVEGSFSRSLKVSGPVDLQLRTGSGRVSIRGGASDSVEIHAVIRANDGFFGGGRAAERVAAIEANPPVEQSGNTIRIGFADDRELYRNVSISYEIVTPAQTQARSHTGSGSQSIEGLRGPVDAQTGSGSLRIIDVDLNVNARTGSGSIEVDGVRNALTARTGSGSIRANHIGRLSEIAAPPEGPRAATQTPARLDLETGSGSIRLQDIAGHLRANTGSGSIQVSGEPEGDWRLHTGSGGVTVELPQNAAFALSARTGSGSIHVDHPLTTQGEIGKRNVRGTVRGGGPSLDIHTGSGGIRIR